MSLFTQGHALIIGVGADLTSTVTDAKDVAAFLSNEAFCAYPDDQVVLLTEKDANVQRIVRELESLAKRTDETSTVIVYYSGHGTEVQTEHDDIGYLLTNGYDPKQLRQTALSGKQFARLLKKIPSKKLLVLFDCCHAGGYDPTQIKSAESLTFVKSAMPQEALDMLGSGSGVAFIASSRASEKSIAAYPHSIFTHALLEALGGKSVARQDGFVRLTDVSQYVGRRVPELVPPQMGIVQNPVLELDRADNFVIAYYAGGDLKPKDLPFDDLRIETEPTVVNTPPPPMQVSVGSGAGAIGDGAIAGGERSVIVQGDSQGNIITGDGNIIGNDNIIGGNKRVGGVDIQVGSGGTFSVGGSIVGGDQINTNVLNNQIDQLFVPLIRTMMKEATGAAMPDAIQKVEAIKAEAKKGDKADDEKIGTLLQSLTKLVPTAITTIASTFANPILQQISGPVTKFVLKQLNLN